MPLEEELATPVNIQLSTAKLPASRKPAELLQRWSLLALTYSSQFCWMRTPTTLIPRFLFELFRRGLYKQQVGGNTKHSYVDYSYKNCNEFWLQASHPQSFCASEIIGME